MNVSSIELKEKLKIKTNRERQVPNSLSDVEITHEVRYEFIFDYLEKHCLIAQNILDYGCGSGYGVKILSKCAENILGVDNNVQILKYANQIFGGSNIKYSIENIESERFDIITCIEMIEHISFEEGHKLLNKFYNLLEEEGILFISTPRKPYGNPYHIYEYVYDELIEILTDIGFSNIETYGQVYDKIDFHKNLLDYYENRDKYTMIFVCKK